MREAFTQALANATRELGEDVAAFDMDDIHVGATCVRVRVYGQSGRMAVGVGVIPDPRPS